MKVFPRWPLWAFILWSALAASAYGTGDDCNMPSVEPWDLPRPTQRVQVTEWLTVANDRESVELPDACQATRVLISLPEGETRRYEHGVSYSVTPTPPLRFGASMRGLYLIRAFYEDGSMRTFALVAGMKPDAECAIEAPRRISDNLQRCEPLLDH